MTVGDEHRDQPRLRVLQSFREPRRTTNPYLVQLRGALEPLADVRTFSWPRALRGGYDVLHVHWPERLIRGSSRWQRLGKRGLCLLLLLRLHVCGIPLVRTWHNSTPHDPPSRAERWLLDRLDAATRVVVTMSRATGPAWGRRVVIPHGSYEGWYPFDRSHRPERNRLLYFGRIRPYKGVTQLIDLYDGDFRPPWHLHIAGRPTTQALEDELGRAVTRAAGVSGTLRFVHENELVDELARAAVVVLPHSGMENSGSLILALSAHRPVIAPRTPTNEAIRCEVGPEWLHLYPEPLTADGLLACWDRVMATAHDRVTPDLANRSWLKLGPMYADAYRSARAAR